MAAPCRDESIREIEAVLSQPDSGELALQKSLALLAHMKMDLANFILDSFRPSLLQHAAEAEQQRWRHLQSQGLVTYEYTREWLSRAHAKVAAKPPPPHAPTQGELRRPTFETIFFAAVEELVTSPPQHWPETFEVCSLGVS